MEPFLRAATKGTPAISLDPVQGDFLFRGMSIPENAADFYMPVFQWLENYLSTLPAQIHCRFDLTYFNSSSLKALYQLLARLQQAQAMGTSLQLTWVVEDEDEFMLESGQYFEDLLGITLRIERVPSRDNSMDRKAS